MKFINWIIGLIAQILAPKEKVKTTKELVETDIEAANATLKEASVALQKSESEVRRTQRLYDQSEQDVRILRSRLEGLSQEDLDRIGKALMARLISEEKECEAKKADLEAASISHSRAAAAFTKSQKNVQQISSQTSLNGVQIDLANVRKKLANQELNIKDLQAETAAANAIAEFEEGLSRPNTTDELDQIELEERLNRLRDK